jgi:hypothetical protein
MTIAAGLGLVLGYFAPDILSALQARQMEVAEGLKAHVSD